MLQAYGVWWFPPMVLNCAAFLLSLAWGLLIFTLSWLRWQSGTNGTQVRSLRSILALLGSHHRLPGFCSFSCFLCAAHAPPALTSCSMCAYLCQLVVVLHDGLIRVAHPCAGEWFHAGVACWAWLPCKCGGCRAEDALCLHVPEHALFAHCRRLQS